MNGSKGMGRSRVLASMAMLFGAIFTIMMLPAYAQQDVNPDWYDPAPNAAVAQPAQPAAAVHSRHSPVSTDGQVRFNGFGCREAPCERRTTPKRS
jgi:hypothetical protein